MNGELIPGEEAVVPAESSAVFYGTGCFESFRADRSNIFKFEEHLKRLNEGLNYLSFRTANSISAKWVRKEIGNVLEANRLTAVNARIRIQVSLTESSGYSLQDDPLLIVLISADPLQPSRESVELYTTSVRVVSSAAQPAHLKLSNMLHYRQAFREAGRAGADDALMLSGEGFIAETSIANIFWKKGKTIYTPDIECDILPGIARNSLIEMVSGENEYKVEQGKYKPEVLIDAECTWLTNSVREIVPVLKVDGKEVAVDISFFSRLREKFQQFKVQHLS